MLRLPYTMSRTSKTPAAKPAPRYTDAQKLHWYACHQDYRGGSIEAGTATCLTMCTETGATVLRGLESF